MASPTTVVLIQSRQATLPETLAKASKFNLNAKPLQFDSHRIKAIFSDPNSRYFWDINSSLGGSKVAFGALLVYPPKEGVFREPQVVDSATNWIFPKSRMLSLDSAERNSGNPGIIMAHGAGVLCKLDSFVMTERANFANGPVHAIYNVLQNSAFGLLDANGIPIRFPAFNYNMDEVAWFERVPEGGMAVLTCGFSLESRQYEINATGRLSDRFALPIEFDLDILGHRLEDFGMEGRQLAGEIARAAYSAHSNFVVVCSAMSDRIMQLLSDGGSRGERRSSGGGSRNEEHGFTNSDSLVPVPPHLPTRTGTNKQARQQESMHYNVPYKPCNVVVGSDSGTYSFRVGN